MNLQEIWIQIMEIIGKIHADGNSVIIVTHEEDISLYAHRVIRLRDGIVETDKINANPAIAAITA
jgi:putative ABC transport system ATP-binding protein